MDSTVLKVAGRRILVCASAGAALAKLGDANDFLAEAWAQEVDMLAIPAARLGEDFFDLRTGLAGEIGQKFANYRMPLAIIGDLTQWIAKSRAFRDYVREANAGSGLWFVADQAALVEKASVRRG
ncbi:DUF4180 domain-containing protein [Bosea sp. NPDC003192]|uniref:DUF4180 domain-containing protein n=1 Tax=Bosea sp. NPDC003192 TaxID=3390551 RepID=UPI003D03CFC8